MRLSVQPTPGGVADEVAFIVRAALAARPGLVLGLPTGRTPVGLYRRLSAMGLDWRQARTFNLDEFVGVAPEDPRSFRGFMDQHLFGHVNLDPAAIGFLRGNAADLAAECERYESAIAHAGGLDLLICGLGANGHIGFNEPGPGLAALTHVAQLHEETRAANAEGFGGDRAAVPSRALTMGMSAILRARRLVVMATGSGKAQAVQSMLRGPLTTGVPASWLQVHPALHVVVDEAAASALGGR